MPAMDLRTEIRYPGNPDVVAAMLADEAFLDAVAKATGALSHEVSVTRQGAGFTTRLHRVMPAIVPDFVRKFTGETLDVVEVTAWSGPNGDGSRDGTLDVSIHGAPVTMRGTTTLRPDGDAHTVHDIDTTIKASLPLVGGKIEQSAAEAISLAARKQQEVAATWLDR